LIGVEDYASKLDPYMGKLCHAINHATAQLSDATFIGSESRFADAVLTIGIPIVGVDSEGLKCEIDMTCTNRSQVPDHPANVCRSKNFVLSLFEERKERELGGI
jgi:hypothetical protein